MRMLNEAYNIDCMEYMKNIPDNYFDLAVVDPPYGSGSEEEEYIKRFGGIFDKYKIERTGGGWAKKYGNSIIEWDKDPKPEYFTELFRVSRNQVIFGGNYFNLPPTRCFLVWDKMNISNNFSMAACEYAWTSFNKNAKIYRQTPQDKNRFHPTQKPVALYEFIYNNFAETGQKILDTHLGSGSSRIAAYNCGLNFVGTEIDKRYYELSNKRFFEETAQINIYNLEDANGTN